MSQFRLSLPRHSFSSFILANVVFAILNLPAAHAQVAPGKSTLAIGSAVWSAAVQETVPLSPITFVASGGSGSGYKFSATSVPQGILQSGITLSSAGVLSGTPSTGSHGVYDITVTLVDSAANTTSVGFTLTVTAPTVPLTITSPTSLAMGTEGTAYPPVTFSATGGTGIYTWDATGLPAGLSMSAGGVLSGTPAAGDRNFTVTVTVRDSAGNTGQTILTLPIQYPAALYQSPMALPSGTEGTSYGVQFQAASWAILPLTWSATGLPSGLSMSSSGYLSGTPATGSHGSYTVTATVRDSGIAMGTSSLTLTILPSAPAITGPTSLASATEGIAYGPVTFSLTGGTPGYSWSASGLPSGLSMSAAGVLSGTPAAGSHGSYSLQVWVTDFAGKSSPTVSLSLTVQAGPLTITGPSSLGAATTGQAYSQVTFSATGGAGGYTWSATGLPSGLSITSGGALSGTPATGCAGSYSVTVTVRDSAGATAQTTLSLSVQAPPLTVTGPSSLPAGTESAAYGPVTFTATGGSGNFVWSATGLPNGLSLASTGALAGTPAAGSHGSYPIAVTVKDAANKTATANLTLTVQLPPIHITGPSSLPAGVESAVYSPVNFSATGGDGSYTWSATNLPSGLSMSSSGVLSGTPAPGSQAGYVPQVTVRDASNDTATLGVPLQIFARLSINPAYLGGTVGVAIATFTFTATGGTGGYTWSATNLPTGLSLSSSGTLTGTPAAGTAGARDVQITVRDSSGNTATLTTSCTIQASSQPLVITAPSPLPPAMEGVMYGQALSASGNAGAVTWSASGLPSGLTVGNGMLSGIPQTGTRGTYSATVTATDTANNKGSLTISLTVQVAPLQIANTATLPTASENASYSATSMSASGGTPPYTWSATGLPAGLSITSAGLIAGTPTSGTAGNYTVQITVRDSTNNTASVSMPLSVISTPLTITSIPLSWMTVGVLYGSLQFSATGGTPPYTWSATGLPNGLTMSSAGTVSGTPADGTAGDYTVVVKVVDHLGTAVVQNCPLLIKPSPISYTGPVPLPNATENTPYNLALTAKGGTPPYSWSATGLPSGMSITLPDQLTGTPGTYTAGNYTVTLNVYDSARGGYSFSLPLRVIAAPTITGPASMPSGTAGVAYGPVTPTAVSGTPPYSWTASGLPTGLTISSAGVVSGTPASDSQGTYSVAITVHDANSQLSTRSYSLVIKPGLQITGPSSLPAATTGTSYGPVQLAASGGSSSQLTWSLSAGTLPSGLTLSTAGSLSGTPATGTAGSYNLTFQVSDGVSSATTSLTLTVKAYVAPLTITGPYIIPDCTEQVPCPGFTASASGGTPPYTWSATGLPPGISFSSAGVFSGTPPAGSHGYFTVVMTVQDANSQIATKYYTFNIHLPLQFSGPSSLAPATVGVSYGPVVLTASGGSGTYNWQLLSGSLPTGLSLAITQGTISGTPAAGTAGTYNLTIQIADGSSAVKVSLSLTVQTSASPLTVAGPATLPVGGALTPYGPLTFTASGGSGGYTWSATGVPQLMTFSTTGVLSGTPQNGGSYSLTITVRDSSGAAAVASQTLLVNPPITVAANPPNSGQANVPYGPFTFSAAGGSPPYVFTATSGLPSGLTLSSAGVLSGTPAATTNAYSLVSITITDSLGNYNVITFGLTITSDPSPLSIASPAALPVGHELAAYGPVTFTTSGGTAPITWTSTGLPSGLTVSSAGILSGTPSAGSAGSYTLNAVARDVNSRTASVALALTVSAGALTVSPSTLPVGTIGKSYGPVTLTAAGGTAPYSWSVTSGIPNGLTLSTAGVLSGTPAAGSSGSYNLTVTVRDSNGVTSIPSWPLAIQSSALTIASPSALTAARETIAYPQTTFVATGGGGGYTWSATGLPIGLSMSAAGMLSGTPGSVSHGSYTVTVKVQDSSLNTATSTYALTVYAYPLILGFTPPLPSGQVGVPYSFTLTATDAAAPYIWSAQSALPAGLTLSSGGLLSGTPTTPGTYSIWIQVRDAQNYSLTAALTLTISDASARLAITATASFPNGTEQVLYADTYFYASGGSGGYTWSASGLPAGLSLSPGSSNTGESVVKGTPAAGTHGTYSVTVNVKDSGGSTTSLTLPLTILSAQPPAIASPTALGPYTETAPVAGVTFAANGGVPPYSWSATGLPTGLSLASSGAMTGTPQVGSHGSYSVKVTVQDSNQQSAAQTYPLTVNAPPQITGPVSLPQGTAGTNYGPVTLTATGGSNAYMWSASGLPQGLSIGPNGILSGIPASAGTFNVTVKVTDFWGASGSTQFSLTIAPAQSSVTFSLSCSTREGPAQVGSAYSASCTATGGAAPYHWSLTGTLPPGLSFNTQIGAISGAPSATGSYSYSIVVTDSGTPVQTTSQAYSGTIQPAAFTVTPGSLNFSGQPGHAITPQNLSISPGGIAFQATSGQNCSWLQVSPLSGASPAQLTVSVNSPSLNSGTYTCNLAIAGGGYTQNVLVTMQLIGPTLIATPSALTFSATAGGAVPAPQTMNVVAADGSAVSLNTTSTCNWLTVAQSSAVTPTQLTVSVQPAGLAASTYTCSIMISAPAAGTVQMPSATLRLNPAALNVSLLSVSLTAQQGDTTPVNDSLSLTGPDAPASFSISISGGAWLTASSTSSTTPATVNFHANPTGLAAGSYTAIIHITSAGNDTPITVDFTVTHVTVRVVPPSLSFHFQQGSTPASQILSVITSNNSVLPFQFQTTSRIKATAGPGAGNVTIAVTPGIAAGTYSSDSVTLTATGSTTWQQTIPVAITVDPIPATPVLTVAQNKLMFSAAQGATAASQLLVAANQGAAWSPQVTVSTSAGGGWLRASSVPASVNDGAPFAISVTADPSLITGAAAGVFTGEVLVANTAANQTVHVPVSLTVNPRPSILLSRQGLGFSAIQGSTNIAGETVDLVNTGLGTLTWTATAATRSGGSWLQLTPASGTAAGGTVANIGVALNAASLTGLAPGTYYGSIVVTASDAATGLAAANSPQTVAVTLNLLPPTAQLGPSVRPGALILTAGNPGESIAIDNPNTASISYAALAVTDDGNSWCSALPSNGTVNGTATLNIEAAFSKLTAGVHTCTVQVSFSDGSSQTISTLAVVPPSAVTTSAQMELSPHAASCTPTGLVAAMREPSLRSTVPAFQATALEVMVVDTCGNPVDDAATSISFSVADTAITAHPVGNGLYRASWTPNAVPTNVPSTTVTLQAVAQTSAGQGVLSGNAQPVTVSVQLNGASPVTIQSGGIVDSASLVSGGLVAPCGWITIFGQNLASGTQSASVVPLPTTLQSAQLFLGGLSLPLLYVSPTQINAQAPCGIATDSEQNLVVVNGAAQSATAEVVVAAAQPAIFTLTQQGTGQAAAFWTTPAGAYVLADANNPVKAGDVIEIYCTGLGAVNPAISEGALSPADQLSRTVLPVSVSFGGVDAQVSFAGLTPGAVGLYQVNVTVPTGVPTGDNIELVISMDGHNSRSGATIAVH